MDPPDWAGPIGETEARLLIAQVLVVESVQVAGLSVAQPMGDGTEKLVAFRAGQADGQPGAARLVGIRSYETPAELAEALETPVPTGEVAALVAWGVGDEKDRVYVLTAVDCEAMRQDTSNLEACIADSRRWAGLLGG